MAPIRPTRDFEDVVLPLLPAAFRSAKEDWLLRIVAPEFVRCFDLAGDICVFGCFPQILPVPLAFAIGALGLPKTVYAFDVFDADQSAEWGGAHANGIEVFDDLSKWAAVLPVRAIRGDVTNTCKLLIEKISLLWFDLASAGAIESVLDTIQPLLGANTIIGIHGDGDPERPDVKPWIEDATASEKLISLIQIPESFVGFLRPAKA
jgi:hypothetical protein